MRPYLPSLTVRSARGLVLTAGLGLSLGLSSLGCQRAPSASLADERANYWSRRSVFVTGARGQGPSARAGGEPEAPIDAQRIFYAEHPDRWAWLGLPSAPGPTPPQGSPALVYLHGDFSLAPFDHKVLAPFRQAGFITVAPALRGENGTQGDFTLLFDELDDIRAAVEWAAVHPSVDPQRIYVFGHSIGGGLAALTSLVPGLPVRLTGSSGGIYVPATFERWSRLDSHADLIRFDPQDRDELELRCLGPNLKSMQRPHLAYVGEADRWFHDNVAQVQAAADTLGAPFEHAFVPGDHGGALAASLDAFLARARADQGG